MIDKVPIVQPDATPEDNLGASSLACYITVGSTTHNLGQTRWDSDQQNSLSWDLPPSRPAVKLWPAKLPVAASAASDCSALKPLET